VLQNYEGQVKPYVIALLQEMDGIGDALKELGLKVQTIYIGGGTPTVLADKDINAMFKLLHQKYISPATREITLEAGRPDTLSLRRMKMFKQAGISRICINPQSMNDSTLKRMGRKHNSLEVITAVEWARQAGIDRLNMDLIVGLPGETKQDYCTTISKVLELKPENITLHTLAAKKGSDLARIEGMNWKKDSPVKEGLKHMQAVLRDEGYEPYYLYRQKYMRTDAENTGFSLPDCYCLFNILMIEERQTIIGVGGGAASKLIDSQGKITSIYNPTDPDSYCKAVPELVRRKVDNLRALN
jgi:oxygen-independent coproporphyrinogen-3 oxidase